MSLGKRAVILGGSIAGMCAAGAVAPYFDEVLVLERDIIPADAEHRRGIPQSKHPHFLLNSGRRAMDDLFPGFEDALLDAGGLHMMASLAAAHCEGDYWVPRKEAPMTMVYASRLLIERTLRDRLATVPNIRVEEGINIEGLETVDGGQPGGRVTGVWVTGGDGGRERRLVEGDFIIDTLGRGSNVSDWLVNAGWPEVRVQSLDAGVTYVSRWYQKPADLPAEWWWAQMSVMPTADTNPHPIEHDFLCQIFPIEGERVLVTMGSWGHPMPRKEEEFLETVSKVRAPAFARAVAMCEPISKVFVTKSTGNRRRRYDELANPPAGLVVIGDAPNLGHHIARLGIGVSLADYVGDLELTPIAQPRRQLLGRHHTVRGELAKREGKPVEGVLRAWVRPRLLVAPRTELAIQGTQQSP